MKLNQGTERTAYSMMHCDLPLQLERRLEALGMTEGSTVLILRKKNRGAMIIKVRGTRFALGKGISEHITIREVNSHGA